MAFPFHLLPFDICREILWHWVCSSINDVDQAYANHELRKQYLSWVANIPVRLQLPAASPLFITFILKRKLRIKELVLELRDDEEFILQQLYNLIAEYDTISPLNSLPAIRWIGRTVHDSLMTQLPALSTLNFQCHCLEDAGDILQQLPNPHLLRQLTVHCREELILDESAPSQMCFWSICTHLTKLHLDTHFQYLTADVISYACRSWVSLQELWLQNVNVAAADLSSQRSVTLPNLHSLTYEQLSRSMEQTNALNKDSTALITSLAVRCPELRRLVLRNVPSLAVSVETLIVDVLPRLNHFEWKNALMSLEDSRWMISAPPEQTLAAVIDVQAVANALAQPAHVHYTDQIAIFNCLRLPSLFTDSWSSVCHGYSASMQIVNRPSAVVDRAYFVNLHFLTSLTVKSVMLGFGAELWVSILRLPSLERLELHSCSMMSDSFGNGVMRCSELGLSSAITALTLTQYNQRFPQHLSSHFFRVFPHLQVVKYQVVGGNDADFLFLLRLPKLERLDFGDINLSETDEPWLLNTISADTWERVATACSCKMIVFQHLTTNSWSGLKRMVQSSMGTVLRRIYLSTFYIQFQTAWKELLAAKEGLRAEQRRCRVQLKLVQ